jgi:hypothetical protein
MPGFCALIEIPLRRSPDTCQPADRAIGINILFAPRQKQECEITAMNVKEKPPFRSGFIYCLNSLGS